MASNETRLTLLKVDLGLMHPTSDQITYLTSLLDMAASAIVREGIALVPDRLEDDTLVEMYAAWLYRKRLAQEDKPMPRMLRWQLNNKLLSQKMKVTNDL